MRGQVKNIPVNDGMCLAFVRVVVQQALGITYDEFYSHRVMVERASPDRDPWARDMERGLRKWEVKTKRWGPEGDPKRYAVLDHLKPGDLLFRWDTARNPWGDYVGHVGIHLGGGLVMESIGPEHRPTSARVPKHYYVVLTPLGEWPVTTVVRWRR